MLTDVFIHSHIYLSIHKNTVFVVWIYQAFPAFVPFNLIGNMPLSQCSSMREGFILCLLVLKSLYEKDYQTHLKTDTF